MFNGNFLDFFFTMMIIFLWVIAIMIWVQCFMDLFRRDDLSGGKKVVWMIFLFFIPWITVLAYMLMRPKVTAQDVQTLARADAANQAVRTRQQIVEIHACFIILPPSACSQTGRPIAVRSVRR